MKQLVPNGQVLSRVTAGLVEHTGIVFVPTYTGYGVNFYIGLSGKKEPAEAGSGFGYTNQRRSFTPPGFFWISRWSLPTEAQ